MQYLCPPIVLEKKIPIKCVYIALLVEETSEPVYSHLTIRIVSVIPPDQCCHNDTFYTGRVTSLRPTIYVTQTHYLCL